MTIKKVTQLATSVSNGDGTWMGPTPTQAYPTPPPAGKVEPHVGVEDLTGTSIWTPDPETEDFDHDLSYIRRFI